MTEKNDLLTFLKSGQLVAEHKPWPRYRLTRSGWFDLISRLEHADWSLLGLWAEPQEVHAAFYDEANKALGVASLSCPEGSFPSMSRVRPGAIRLERTIQDLTGLVAEYLNDGRPWLDHGQFPIMHPLANSAGKPTPRPATDYTFLEVKGEGLHQIPVGPVHAGVIEPGHFRFTCNGETVVRLEERLGYVHKGIERHMQGKTIDEAAKIAARVSGDSTVSYSLAFARAVEAALGVDVSARAHALRAVMAELERLANHFGDIGSICNDAAFAFMLSKCHTLREKVAATAAACFGHRFIMDRVVPGGVAVDLTPENIALLIKLMSTLRREFSPLVELYDNKSSMLDRTVTTGFVSGALVHRFAAGGFVGRASSRGFDVRQVMPYPPYDNLDFEVPVFSEGDVNARVQVRIAEIWSSLTLIEHLLRSLPKGALKATVPASAGEGMALVEAFRGDILLWVRIGADGKIIRCHPRDASWFQWPLLENSIENNIVADFPLCNKSFNCSYSGQDS